MPLWKKNVTPVSGRELPSWRSVSAMRVVSILVIVGGVLLSSSRAVSDEERPTRPQNLRASVYSETSLELFWGNSTDNDGIAYYQVFLDNSRFRQVPGASLYLDSLQPGTQYAFRVSAFDTTGAESGRSSTLLAVTNGDIQTAQPQPQPGTQPQPDPVPQPEAGAALNPPGSLTLVGSTADSIDISWQAASSGLTATGFNVYLNGDYLATVRDNTSYTAGGLNATTDYRFTLVAFDDNGRFSSQSSQLLASTVTAGVSPDPQPAPDPQPIPDPQPAPDPQPQPTAGDPFGTELEIDNETALAGNPPTTPKNLRADLVSNNWVTLNWAPANDDGRVVRYNIYRDDGVVYSISESDGSSDTETDRTLKAFWRTTTYMDCNYTHIRRCTDENISPQVNAVHSYQVTAVDEAGNESPRSNTLSVNFHSEQGDSVAAFSDPFLDSGFVFNTDFSNTSNFLNQFELVFSDEFNGSSIDSSKWTTSLTFNQVDSIINGEQQYFVDTQNQPDFGYNPFVMTGETLLIEGIPTPDALSSQALGQPFLSGALSSHEIRSGQTNADGSLIEDKFALTYGYVEGRIRVGTDPGNLSSFYLFRRWFGEHAPEIDILEYLGENPFGDEKAFQTYHYTDPAYGVDTSVPTMQFPRFGGRFEDVADIGQFHTYGVLWEPQLIIWYIDGEEVQRITGPMVARQSMNIVFYLVTGSAWAPTPSQDANLEMEIDYVRAYQRPAYIR